MKKQKLTLTKVNQADVSNKKQENDFTLHVMPSKITDEDIAALFNGLLKVVQKKFELDNKAEILNLNISRDKLIKALQEKEAECIRLKNEIIYLKSNLKTD